jgi:hypothetical protein
MSFLCHPSGTLDLINPHSSREKNLLTSCCTSYLRLRFTDFRQQFLFHLTSDFRDVRRGVSKGVEDSHRPPAHRLIQGWPSTGCRRVEHSGPYQYFRETEVTPWNTPLSDFITLSSFRIRFSYLLFNEMQIRFHSIESESIFSVINESTTRDTLWSKSGLFSVKLNP